MQEAKNISISTGSIIRTVLILALFVSLWFIRDIILVLLTSIVLASALEPSIQFFVKRKMPRVLAMICVYGASIGGFFALMYFFIPAFLQDMSTLIQAVPDDYNIIGMLFGGDGATHIGAAMDKNASLFEFFARNISNGGFTDVLMQFFGGFASFILVLVLSFYLSATERGIENFLRVVTPSRKAGYVVGLWYRSQKKIGLWFQGQMLLGVLVGVLTFIGLLLFGVKSAFFLAVIMIAFEVIPVFGPVLAAIPGIAIAFNSGISIAPNGGLSAALIITAMYVAIQQVESHVIYPLVVKKIIGTPPVIVIISLLIGWTLAGFMGVVLAVPVATTLMEYLNDISLEKMDSNGDLDKVSVEVV